MIAGLTGLCTLMGLVMINSWRSFGTAIVAYGIPFLMGLGMIAAGRALIRDGRDGSAQ
jgi:hypothetical protein